MHVERDPFSAERKRSQRARHTDEVGCSSFLQIESQFSCYRNAARARTHTRADMDATSTAPPISVHCLCSIAVFGVRKRAHSAFGLLCCRAPVADCRRGGCDRRRSRRRRASVVQQCSTFLCVLQWHNGIAELMTDADGTSAPCAVASLAVVCENHFRCSLQQFFACSADEWQTNGARTECIVSGINHLNVMRLSMGAVCCTYLTYV